MITVVCTSCGRFDLLEKTIRSFLKFKDLPIEQYIVIDNAQMDKESIRQLFPNGDKVEVIINEKNIGQVASLDIAFSKVNTEYIFLLEDDWRFHSTGFLQKSLNVLKNPQIMNVGIRDRNNGEKGSEHPIYGPFNEGEEYYRYCDNYCGVYHGFSWNPGLRRRFDYEKVAPFTQWKNEEGMNYIYQKLGYYAACLPETYCHHIGEGLITEMRNE